MESKSFPGVVDSLDELRGFIGDLCQSAGLSKKATYNLKLAVDEIATNIILYGYQATGLEGEIDVLNEVTDQKLTVILEDIAEPFNPLEKRELDELDLNKPLEEREIGGLGIFLTIKGVNGFFYEYTGGRNRNKFVMNIDND